MRQDVDRFGAVPLRFAWALQRGDVTADEFFVGAYVVCVADHQTKSVIRHLRGLHEEIGWRGSPQSLRRALLGLREKGWISFDLEAGQRRPWEIRLRELDREPRQFEFDADLDDDLDRNALVWSES